MSKHGIAFTLPTLILILLSLQLLLPRVYSLLGDYDYVDNNTSDLDATADRGTHSNFTAQQHGPDGVFDVLTEEPEVTSTIADPDSADMLKDITAETGADTTAADSEDILTLMTDGDLLGGKEISNFATSGQDYAHWYRCDVEAIGYANVEVRVYFSTLEVSPYEWRMFVYQPDANNIDTANYVDGSSSTTGWTTIDVTSIIHQLDGTGFMKVRLISRVGGGNQGKKAYISEMEWEFSSRAQWTIDLYVDSFDATRNEWSNIGSSPYLEAQDQPSNYVEMENATGSSGETGFKSPSATGDDYTQWSNPGNAYASDNQDAREDRNGQQQDWYDFDLGVPSGVVIVGIQVDVEGNSQWEANGVYIELSWDGGASYTSTGKGAIWSGGSDSYKTFGGSTDTWGRTWSSSEMENSNFRVRLTKNGSEDWYGFEVDHIQVKVNYAESADGKQCGDFGFENSSEMGTIDSVKLRIYHRVNDDRCPNHFFLYDGGSWNDVGSLGVCDWQWDEIDVSTILDTWTKINSAELYVQYDDSQGERKGPNSVDAALLRVEYTPTSTNYELDLEVQWTSVDFDETNEELCIFGGTMGSENIRVDVWNSSGWRNLLTELSSGWNNISVTDYLVSSTFTIRFKGGTETGDPFQDSWEIDSTLIHTWGIAPIANFSYVPEYPHSDETVTFNASESYDPDGSIVSHFWDFGDGTNGTGKITTHSYTDNGNYTVVLTATDNDGLSDTTSLNVTVLNRSPVASFTESAETAYVGASITFNASDSYDPDGYIATCFWDFGDDTNATGIIVEHVYLINGTYIVTLTVIDEDGAHNSTSSTKTILGNELPVASFTESAETVHTGETIYFNASDSYDPDGTIVSFFWDFGDSTNATGKIVNHSYADDGNYTITLTVTDDDNANSLTSATKTVLNRSPVASFTESAETAYTGETITFNASQSSDPDGSIVSYFWDFGDGTNATGMTVSHAYDEDGNRTVTLGVTDDDGAQRYSTDGLTILNRNPVATFRFTPQPPTTDDRIIFNATNSSDSDGTIIDYLWDFGDGNTTITSNPLITHNFRQHGNFNISLTVIDNDGYSDSVAQTITVHIHDVEILNGIISHTVADQGEIINIIVTVTNKGTTPETFDVHVFYNETLIGTQQVTDMASAAQENLVFYWNTTDIKSDVDYEIKAEASIVPGEINIIDNIHVCGTVRVQGRDPPPFDWGPIIPYVAPVGGAIITIVLTVVFYKEFWSLILSLMGALGFAKWKSRKKRKDFGYFNRMTGGGIPDSFSVMISGGVGSGKSVFCQQLVHALLTEEKNCAYFTYDCFPDEIRKSMKNFHWEVARYEDEGQLVFVDSFSSIANVKSRENYSVSQPFSLSDLGITMSDVAREIGNPRIFLDSIVPLLTQVDQSKVVDFLQNRGARIKGMSGVFFFTVGKKTMNPNLAKRLEGIVDCIIELEVSEGKTVRRMRIRKMRGKEISGKWIQFEIDSKEGIVFLV